jgi:alanine racemase
MIDYNKIQVRIDTTKLIQNYQLLSQKGKNIIPVIKANAYGHGLIPTAKLLKDQGAEMLAVGTADEAAELNEVFDGTIISLLGPQDNSDYKTIVECDILPFVFRIDQIQKLNEVAKEAGKKVPVALKFNSGMSRLGFDEGEIDKVKIALDQASNLEAIMLCSHLSSADVREFNQFTLDQAATLERINAGFVTRGLDLKLSLANSAATLAYPDLHYDFQRPGIALFGANPYANTPWQQKGEGLQACMEVSAPIIQIRTIEKGTPVSYGCTFQAQEEMQVAIVASGYADLQSRGLSNKAQMLVGSKRAPVIGRVCMQMTAIDLTHIPNVQIGDRAYLLGGPGASSITPEELAAWWGTITYEVFCALGLNKKQYI